MKKMFLAIESSCDETAAAVVAEGREILSNVVQSSASLHERFGGVVPELASRAHLEAVVPVVDQALAEADLSVADLTGLGVCAGPGLLGSLIVGVSAAKALAFASGKPLVPVHHLASHIAANYLAFQDLEPPFLALVVSGAHAHIVEVQDYNSFVILARTRDDAPGEAYDKISRELGLAYPGGPKLDKLARMGNAQALDLPRPHFEDSLDFSFSGIKTASLNALNKAKQQAKTRLVRREDILADKDLAAAFQEAVVASLLEHVSQALDQTGYDKLVLAGGVSANSWLRDQSEALSRERGLKLYVPPLTLCTDNAAMTAAQSYYAYESGERADLKLNATAMWELGSPIPH